MPLDFASSGVTAIMGLKAQRTAKVPYLWIHGYPVDGKESTD
jgi:hypothetical protein